MDLHACASGQLAALGDSADLMSINTVALRGRIPRPTTSLSQPISEERTQYVRIANVRFGSKADIGEGATDVRFTPKRGHAAAERAAPVWQAALSEVAALAMFKVSKQSVD